MQTTLSDGRRGSMISERDLGAETPNQNKFEKQKTIKKISNAPSRQSNMFDREQPDKQSAYFPQVEDLDASPVKSDLDIPFNSLNEQIISGAYRPQTRDYNGKD